MRSKEDKLDAILNELKRQGTFKYTLVHGILYGVGFFVGSAIIAVMLLGAIAPTLSDIDIFRQTYNDGTKALQFNYNPTEKK